MNFTFIGGNENRKRLINATKEIKLAKRKAKLLRDKAKAERRKENRIANHSNNQKPNQQSDRIGKLYPNKNKPSLYEINIGKYLKKLGHEYFTEMDFPGCINPRTGYSLPFDFYLPDIHMAIEFDGKHHFINEDKAELARQKFRDGVKTRYCERNEIPLLRIPCFDYKFFRKTIDEFIYNLEHPYEMSYTDRMKER